jgi:cobalt-zinc-cadmium efflux system outer membrane protein
MRLRFCLLSPLLLLMSPAMSQTATAPVAAPAAIANDTVALTLADAEQRFLQNNLQLLAQQYNITAAQAQIVQARLWDNPTISLEQNTYNRETGKRFDVTKTGQSIVQVQQLFAIAGRRKAAARVAEQAAQAEQFTFQDLLRNLRYQLRTSFYDLYYQQQSLRVYDQEISSFKHTAELYQQQFQKGNIALKEVVRLQAFLFDLQNERQELLRNMADNQTDLHVLLRNENDSWFRPTVNGPALRALSPQMLSMQQLLDSAQTTRADVLVRQAQVRQQEQNLRLQYALTKPDVAVGYVYDRAGSYIQNYNALTLGVAIPIFDRNQGNIRTAKAQIEGSRLQLSEQQLQVRQEVMKAYNLARQSDELYRATGPDTGDFDRLIKGIEQSYIQKNITIVEFLDFYESYKNNQVQRNELRAGRLRSFEQLNLAVGRPVLDAK